ncbi:SPFH domain / Band 7 family protein [Desulfoplanes formicivorans]|uniref:SPFH domain / Band 7 family protein n=2 Tax=Desulfoplanes formicivorans TaxID=1592317 RepID=A0A194AHC5_9BACT|nr:SPFH domain / Band 7 family protein [Desulfoplanes formicivorans]
MNKKLLCIRRKLSKYRTHCIVFGLAFTLILVFLWPQMVISVRPGELGVLYSRFGGGTQLDRTYQEGLHLIAPWNILFIYDVRIQEETQEVDVLTVDGLTVKVEASLRYQLVRDSLPLLHQQIGPEYKRKVVLPIMTSAVRQTVGSYRPDDLYSSARQELQDKMLVDAAEEMGRIPILVHCFVVRKIVLPEILSKAIEDKLVTEQKYLRYHYLLLEAREEAKRKAIEAQGIRYYQRLVNENMTDNYLRFEGIRATQNLAASQNAKIVVVGGGKDGLPIILNAQDASKPVDGENATLQNVSNASAKQAAPVTGPAEDPAMREKGGDTGWKDRKAQFADFLKQLDATLLNPEKTVLGDTSEK